MSATSLYRVMVRMLFDPDFARAVYAEGDAALVGVALTAEEHGWLVAGDRRAYRTDTMRRARALAGLMEEFPTASAFVLRRGREGAVRPERELLDAFFSSERFHRCVQDGGSMVFAFAAYLALPAHEGVAADPRVAPLVALESAIAELRRTGPPVEQAARARSPHDRRAGGRLALAGWARLVRLPAGTHELHRRVGKALVAHERELLASLLDARWSLPVLLDLDADADEHLLVERPPEPGRSWAETEVRYAPVTAELAGLLETAAGGAGRAELAARARELGAAVGEETSILDGLRDEGLLVADAPRM
jgi:hypothetical protein